MYQIPQLTRYHKLFHAFSTKADGNMANSILGEIVDYDKVIKNRERFLKKVGVDMDKCICMWVTHGDGIVTVPKETIGISMRDYKKAVKVDGLMTNEKGVYLFMLIADCLPIIFYDPKKGVLSLVHAGWKGVDMEITKKAVKKMVKEYGSEPSDIIVGIGPHAHKDSFVKENPAQKDDPRWKAFIKKVDSREDADSYKIDLAGFTKKQLIDIGIRENNIYVSDVDTVKDGRFFSHACEHSLPITKQGRFACVVGMR